MPGYAASTWDISEGLSIASNNKHHSNISPDCLALMEMDCLSLDQSFLSWAGFREIYILSLGGIGNNVSKEYPRSAMTKTRSHKEVYNPMSITTFVLALILWLTFMTLKSGKKKKALDQFMD